MRKRADRDLENAHKYALERFVNELLPVKDSLELGLAAATDSAAVENLREGTEMTLRMLSTAIEKFGVREVNPVGESFNPEAHQAVSTRESAECAAGTVHGGDSEGLPSERASGSPGACHRRHGAGLRP